MRGTAAKQQCQVADDARRWCRLLASLRTSTAAVCSRRAGTETPPLPLLPWPASPSCTASPLPVSAFGDQCEPKCAGRLATACGVSASETVTSVVDHPRSRPRRRTAAGGRLRATASYLSSSPRNSWYTTCKLPEPQRRWDVVAHRGLEQTTRPRCTAAASSSPSSSTSSSATRQRRRPRTPLLVVPELW